MKKLKKLKLHSAVELQEKEMKAVQGGVGSCNTHGALCFGACIALGQMGTCERSFAMHNLCGCVIIVEPEPEPGYGYEYGVNPYGWP